TFLKLFVHYISNTNYKGKPMLRTNDGVILSEDELNELTEDIQKAYDNESETELKKLGLERKDKNAFINFPLLFHTKNKDLQDNFVQKTFTRFNARMRARRKIDPTNKNLTHYEKIIKGTVKNRYKKYLLANNPSKNYYSAKSILNYMFGKYVHRENKSADKSTWEFEKPRYIKKYSPFVKKQMATIRSHHHQFKNTKEVKKFTDEFSNGIYENKFDMDILIRYIAASDKFKADEEDMETLGDILKIVLKPQYDDNEDTITFNAKALEKYLDNIKKDVLNNNLY
ncbi:MAG: hypothetical protein QM490_04430, partial [Candidatus Gracilibacteria bacterium]